MATATATRPKTKSAPKWERELREDSVLIDIGLAVAEGLESSGVEEFLPYPPTERQEIFDTLEHIGEVLYGGAAGGGKSDALLRAALKYVDEPKYAAIIFRQSYTDLSLPGALMERAHEWLDDTGAVWNDNKKRWKFPSGATLTFGFLKNALDKFRYQSAEFQFVGFDELTQFPETDYLYLFSRLRRLAGSDVPLRMRAATNPGGAGHRWVKERFIDPWERGEEQDPDPENNEAGRRFVPAKLSDNPHVDQATYRQNLANLDDFTRRQLEDGDWNARMPGPWVFDHHGLDAAFELGDIFDHLRKEGKMPPPVGDHIILGIDFGESTHVLIGWPLESVPVNRLAISREGCPTLHGQIYDLQFKVQKDGEETDDVAKKNDHGPDALIAMAAPLSSSKKGAGLYIAKEFTYSRGEPDTQAGIFAQDMLSKFRPPFRLGRQRFDASKPESMRLWYRGIRDFLGEDEGKPSKIAFNKFKRQSILHLRKMMEDTKKRADEDRHAGKLPA